MANRRDYYFRQKVTEAELDAGFEGLEAADRAIAVDIGFYGVAAGMAVSQKSGTPNLTVDVSGPGVAYSKAGERIFFSGLQNVNLAADDAAVNTAVAAPGNSRVVSLFVEFDRLLSDPRIDGNSVTVFFQRNESFAFSVVAGAEATTGLEAPPALDPNKILLADITLAYGQTQILNSHVSTARREALLAVLASPIYIFAGTVKEAFSQLLEALNNHVTGAANRHPASQIDYGGSGNWANAVAGIAAGTVEASIDAVVAALAATVTTGGGDRIGQRALTATWAGGGTFTAGTVWSHINKIVSDLAAGAGAAKIGTTPAGDISASTVQTALDELDNDKLAKAGGTVTGNLGLSGNFEVNYTPAKSRVVSIPLVPWMVDTTWGPDDTTNFGEWVGTGGANDSIQFDLLQHLPNGALFQSLTIVWDQSAGFASAADQIQASLYRHQLNFNTGARTVTQQGSTIAHGAGTGVTITTLNPTDFTIDKVYTTLTDVDTALILRVEQAASGTSRILGVRITFEDPGPRNI